MRMSKLIRNVRYLISLSVVVSSRMRFTVEPFIISSSTSVIYSSPHNFFFETTKHSSCRDEDADGQITTNNERIIYKTNSFPERSYWKSKKPKSRFEKRILLEELYIGQELSGFVVEELLDARTGPKVWFECGVSRRNPKNGKWSIVHGMLRLGSGRSRKSVTKKRSDRLRKKCDVILYVTRIQTECARLEVCVEPEYVTKYSSMVPKISVTSLKEKQVVTGVVSKLYDYGAIIDIGANRNGLLHIKKVATLLNQYIDKKKGLEDAGLEKGAKVELIVQSVVKRRISLDFTDDVKQEARKELALKLNEQKKVNNAHSIDSEELASWEAYVKKNHGYGEGDDDKKNNDGEINKVGDDDYEVDDDDYEYDEDSEIESALGLDTY